MTPANQRDRADRKVTIRAGQNHSDSGHPSRGRYGAQTDAFLAQGVS